MRPASATTVREVSWERVACPRLSKKQPTADNVESLINSLTGTDPGTVVLTVANRHVLTIIGDSEQGFVVRISSMMASKQLFALAPPDQQSGTVVLVVGNQREEYPRRILVDRATALRAARGFWQRGLPDEYVNWTADSKSIR
ncbi:MAG: Imm1 family immunity protein [Steroidobacteraceae bacterium]